MSALHRHVADYLRMRRALGYRLERAGLLLPQLVDYLEAAGASTVTADLAIAWARLPDRARPNHWSQLLAIARGFATYLQTIDPLTQVPPSGVFPTSRHRPTPYRWSRADIARVMQHAEGLHPRLRAATFQTVFGLLVVTGMRLGEVVGLTRDDVDTVAGVITIRHAKFDRVRLVPLHPTTTAALQSYAAERDRLCPHPRTASFFINTTGTPVQRNTVQKPCARSPRPWESARPPSPTRTRPAAPVRCGNLDRLAHRGPRRRRAHGRPVNLSGPREPRRHLLVPVGDPRNCWR